MKVNKAIPHYLSEKIRLGLIKDLNQVLINLSDLHSQTKQAHWNVVGPDFYATHKFFDDLAGSIEPFIDVLAERVTALGGAARGTSAIVAAESELQKYPEGFADSKKHMANLSQRYALISERTAALIEKADEAGDKVSADLFTELSALLEKNSWFLAAHHK